MPQQKVIIIGAGIAGIATAIRLAIKGYRVEVFEANSYPGGKLSEFTNDGVRFDAGPSLFTMPQYVDELFELAGKNPSDYFTYKKLDVTCKYFYEDGTQLNAYADTETFINEVTTVTGEPAENIKRYLDNSREIYDITNPVFLERSLHKWATYLRWQTVKSFLRLPRIDALRTMHEANQGFFKDDRMVQFYDRYATYNGSNPYSAPATLNVIPHLEQQFGAYFPDGGMYSITRSLVALAQSLGVQFIYNTGVDEIVASDNKAKGVLVKGETVYADVVVANMDVWFTYKKLLGRYPKIHPKKILQQERSSSALIFYWEIKKQFPQLGLHNIFFSADYKAEFDHIWDKADIYHDPTIYINITSKYKPDDAPAGCENWFTMINVPANNGQQWEALVTKARTDIVQKLSKLLGEDIKNLISSESVSDPRSIQDRTSSWQGSIYGTASNNKFAAFLRHQNRSAKIKNLYFCGGSVHPGGGIPLCLLSAKIVSQIIG